MTLYALLKGCGSTNTFHGVTTSSDAADAWFNGDAANFHFTFESDDDGGYHRIRDSTN